MSNQSRQISTEDLPYHRTYGRVLAAMVSICIPISWTLPPSGDSQLGFGVRFVSLCMAALWCPVLVYCGIRTKNLVDFVAGLTGAATLFYWIPNLFKL